MDRDERNAEIVTMARRGIEVAKIADHFGLSVDRIRFILRESGSFPMGFNRWRIREAQKIADGQGSPLSRESRHAKIALRDAEIARRYISGETCRSIGYDVGLCERGVHRIVDTMGVERPPGTKLFSTIPVDPRPAVAMKPVNGEKLKTVEEVVLAVKSGKTIAEVAKLAKRSTWWVHHHATKDPELAMGIVAYKRKKRAEQCHG